MSEKKETLKSPASIKLASLKDLVRLVISTVGPDRNAGYIGHHEDGNRTIYFIFNTSLGYYDLNALPIIVWVEDTEFEKKSFLRYKTQPEEKMDFSNDTSDAKWLLNIPIVTFEEMPVYLKVWEK